MKASKNGNSTGVLVPAVDRAALILRAIASSKTPIGVSELSRQLGLNKSTTHDILNTLCHHHLLERDSTKTYRLGYGLVELGHHVGEHMDLRAASHSRLVQLAHAVEETVFLGTYHEGYVTIIDKEEAPHDVKITSPLGRRLHYSAAAYGKVFLAAMSDSQVNQLMSDDPLHSYTPKSITKPNAFRAALRQVRAQGYALDDEEYLAGVRAAAAPINDAHGNVVGALCVVGFSTRLSVERLERVAKQTRDVAQEISCELGATEYPMWNGVG
ncbi:MAG: IclR family transcriptional regulator [Chloroflexi bacterium]|nr:IclR family transcriptional regulator [Chloroflexota bacterium]